MDIVMPNDRSFLPKMLYLFLRPQLLLQEVGIPRAVLNFPLLIPRAPNQDCSLWISVSGNAVGCSGGLPAFRTSPFRGSFSSAGLMTFFPGLADWDFNIYFDAEISACI